MVTNENNSFINSFNKGMNSDTAFDQIENAQYIYGQNIRITKNQFLGSSGDYSSVHEGIVTPVPSGVGITINNNEISGKIIAVESIERLGVIITADGRDMNVYKIKVDETTNQCTYYDKIWSAANLWKGVVPDKISTVLYKELENVIKLYIADGEHPIISLRVDDESDGKYYNQVNNTYTPVDDLINNRIIPNDRIQIVDIISGRLITQQVQYTYRYYNKYGNTTQLAPLTNKIQVIDPSRSKEIGNAENTETSIGFQLSINTTDYTDTYDRLQIYRLSYITEGQDAEVALIYDGKIKENPFILNDVGIDPLQKLSMEEFSAMSGLILVPQVIEQNQEYMFCGNIKDDTIIRGVNISKTSYDLVKAQVVLSDKIEGDIPDPGNHLYYRGEYNDIKLVSNDTVVGTVSNYFQNKGISPELAKASYNNIFTSSLLRSLRRGEEYKYAIVFYDKYGRRTDVKNICDVSVPNYRSSYPFDVEDGSLIAYPIGVNISIPNIDLSNSDISLSDIVGCQIVRRSSSEVYQRTLLQVALARPISQGLAELTVSDLTELTESTIKKSPYYPSGLLYTSGMYILPDYYMPSGDPGATQDIPTSSFMGGHYKLLAAQTGNHRLYQIFSSEIDFRRNDVLSRVNASDSTIQEVLYIPSIFSKYKNGTKYETYDGTFPINTDYNKYTMSATTVNGYTDPSYQNTISQHMTGPDGKLWFYIDPSYVDTSKSMFFSVNSADVSNGTLIYVENQGQDPVVYGPVVYMGQDIANNWSAKNFINSAINNNKTLFLIVNYNENVTALTIDVQARTESTISDEGFITIRRDRIKKLHADDKLHLHYIFNFFNTIGTDLSGFGKNNVNQIKDVKIPNWDSGFTEVYRDDSQSIERGIKKYKSFATNIDSFTYNNWVSFGKYDLRPGYKDTQANMAGWGGGEENQELVGTSHDFNQWVDRERDENTARCGFIGAGPSCFLLTTEKETGLFPLLNPRIYTSICNIQHNPKNSDVQSDDYISYYGFGNYFPLKVGQDGALETVYGSKTLTVFDGDTYITPHEFTTCYKAYDFNSVDTLQSTQVTNYIPLESKVNTYFDYGMNLVNTQSENLIYEPGHIDGVTTQDRPVHQYNMIYSDNDASNDIFTLISTDDNETNQFKQRAYYSDLKTNGEFIDNFLIFKAVQFIDVDAKYGQITDMLTDKNTLYYWQDHACGRFSVNERSLINDQNSNTIMLGQAGILSRYDYISTRYGMRLHDFCAKSTEGGVFWVDINNKAIAALAENKAVNYGEQLNVQNIINNNITSGVPKVDYDLQNDELLCKCFGDNQIVFNIKYNLGTSIYTRRYSDMLYIKNHLYGLSISNDTLSITKHNYLTSSSSYLSPVMLSFIVNPAASIVKVYDSQQLIPIKRDAFTTVDHAGVLDGTVMSFETDIINKPYSGNMEPHTDREGNIIYNIPRYTTGDGYGNRVRGKWLRVNINSTNPTEYLTISHIITKFRQSYS